MALDHPTLLRARLQALPSMTTAHSDRSLPLGTVQGSAQTSPTAMTHVQTRQLELPPLPIPVFAGNMWEWDNFWEIFNNNIHSRDIPEMVKYNYLLDASRGEARECIMKFRETKENYAKAVMCLRNKYSDGERLVNQLVVRLEACTLHPTPSIKDQRSLSEQLQAITAQLEDKGEDINSSWLIKNVLAKFPDSTKRKVITKRQGLSGTPFTMTNPFKFIDEILSAELYTDSSPQTAKGRNFYAKRRPYQPMTATCMYCKKGHSVMRCTTYTTPQDRSAQLRRNKLGLICASPSHASD
uniref:DUF1758 domain-containing protein n=1 Tax=Haemonchus contortus TaxID=6289 RepID=A0A7I4Z3J8_HAECO